MRVVVAPDKFRGTATAFEAARAIAAGVRRAGHDAVELPLADGGEGLLEVLGGANRVAAVTGPLGDEDGERVVDA
ncbi:MAG TPA: glycerate kinase, partial [Microthrixaceae bacterium]|nr:glycerate kinase [Microthrixaceae bacterium]